MAVNTSAANSLKSFISKLRTGNTNCAFDSQIIGFYMHLRGPGNLSIPAFLYDVILTDASVKIKCALDFKKNMLIEKGYLTVGSTVRIKTAHMREFCVVIDDLVVTGHADIPDPTTLRFLKLNNSREVVAMPLLSKKMYYLNPWVTDVPHGDHIFARDPLLNVQTQLEVFEPMTLRELELEAPTMMLPYPTLVVTVFHRGKLHHFGKCGDAREFPFQGYLLLADHTAVCKAVMWETRNIGTWNRLNPGCLLWIRNYQTRIPNQKSHKCNICGHFKALPVQNQELSLNHGTKIHVLTEAQAAKFIPRGVQYPLVKYRFVSRSLLSYLPNNETVDVVGLVTYVGHFLRIRDSKKPGNFNVVRWIEMKDETSPFPFRILLFMCCPIDKQEDIVPGDVLACTQLRICRIRPFLPPATSQGVRPTVYLKMTIYSMLTRDQSSIRNENRAKELLLGIEQFQDHFSAIYRVGGFVSYPFAEGPKPNDTLLAESIETAEPLLGTEWASKLETLVLREHRTVILHGKITSIYCVHVDGTKYDKELIFFDMNNFKQTTLTNDNWTLAFPQLFVNCPQAFRDWIKLPSFCATDKRVKHLSETERNKLPFLKVDGYVITIVSQDDAAQMMLMFFPKPSQQPHPSLREVLQRHYHEKGFDPENDPFMEPTTYSDDEIECVSSTTKDIHLREFKFLVDWYCYGKEKVVAILRVATEL